MRGQDLLLLLALAALWSASFLFIKIAVAEVTPAFIVLARLVFGSLPPRLRLPDALARDHPSPRPDPGASAAQ